MDIKDLVAGLVRTDGLAQAAAQFVKSKTEKDAGDPELWFQHLVTAYNSYMCECGNATADYLVSRETQALPCERAGLEVVRRGDEEVEALAPDGKYEIEVRSPSLTKPLVFKNVVKFDFEERFGIIRDQTIEDRGPHSSGIVTGTIHYTRILKRGKDGNRSDQT